MAAAAAAPEIYWLNQLFSAHILSSFYKTDDFFTHILLTWQNYSPISLWTCSAKTEDIQLNACQPLWFRLFWGSVPRRSRGLLTVKEWQLTLCYLPLKSDSSLITFLFCKIDSFCFASETSKAQETLADRHCRLPTEHDRRRPPSFEPTLNGAFHVTFITFIHALYPSNLQKHFWRIESVDSRMSPVEWNFSTKSVLNESSHLSGIVHTFSAISNFKSILVSNPIL